LMSENSSAVIISASGPTGAYPERRRVSALNSELSVPGTRRGGSGRLPPGPGLRRDCVDLTSRSSSTQRVRDQSSLGVPHQRHYGGKLRRRRMDRRPPGWAGGSPPTTASSGGHGSRDLPLEAAQQNVPAFSRPHVVNGPAFHRRFELCRP